MTNYPHVEEALHDFHRMLVETEVLPGQISLILKALGPLVNAVGADSVSRTRLLMYEDVTRLGKTAATDDYTDVWLSGFVSGTIMSAGVIEGGRDYLEQILAEGMVERMRTGMNAATALMQPDLPEDEAEALREKILEQSRERLLAKVAELKKEG